MSLEGIAILFIALLFLLFTIGFEIGFAMCLVGFIGFACIVDVRAALNLLTLDFYNVFINYGFTVIPLFVLMGQIAFHAGIAKDLFSVAYRFIGHVPGGLAMATVAGAAAFGSVTGSATATAATFASIAVPEMDRYGYSRELSSGTVAAAGVLGCLIPPSVPLIIYGIIAEQSIAQLFLATIIPGIFLAGAFIATISAWSKINPKLGPKGERFTWKQRLGALTSVIPVLGIFIVVMGGLMVGYFTPTEAGSVGAFAVLLVSLAKRDFKGFIKSVSESLYIACMILVLLAGGTVLSHFFAVTKIPFIAGNWLLGLPFSREWVMMIIMFIYLIGGSFIEDMAFLILITPIFVPIVTKLGYDLIWFGIMVQGITMIGIVIPPIAINVFVVSSVVKLPLSTVYKGAYPYMAVMGAWLIILLIFPQISLWLPNLLMK
jgi:C4-dicarboxylate transporter DctM subunit